MPPEEPFVPGEWYRLAHRDLDRAERLLDDEDYLGAGIHLQQAAEKYLKGFLLSKGWRLRKIHDLAELLSEAVSYLPGLESYRKACQRITRYYVTERYPDAENSEPTRQEIEEDLAQVKAVIQLLHQDR